MTNKTSRLLIFILLLGITPIYLYAQENRSSKEATAGNINYARSLKSVITSTTSSIDSVGIGVNYGGLLPSAVTIPNKCALDNTLKGCDGYCTANPSSPECGSSGSATPPVGGDLNSPPPGYKYMSGIYDECGDPVDDFTMMSKGCSPTKNGYHCPVSTSSSVVLGYRCR